MILINKSELLDHVKYMSEIKIDQLEEMLDSMPTTTNSEVAGYIKWLEKIYVETESVVLCEDMADEWCEENCEFSSIQPICLRHIYKTYIKDGERGEE